MGDPFSPEQDALRATARQALAKIGDAAVDRLGLAGLIVPERYGGAGGTLVDAAIVVEEAGRVLRASGYLMTVAVAAALAPSGVDGPGPSDVEVLGEIAAGAGVAFADAEPRGAPSTVAEPVGGGHRIRGVKDHVWDGADADASAGIVAVVAGCGDGPGLFAVRVGDVTVHKHSTLDQTRGRARLVFDGSPARRLGADPGRVRDLMRILLAVESVGVARASLEMTVAHLKARKQFGVPLATFQALRHRVADLVVSVEAATSTAWYAVRAAASGDPETNVLAPLALAVAADAAYTATAESIQLHGGIGFTWEHDAHRYFKRATVNRFDLGDPVTLRRLVADRAGL